MSERFDPAGELERLGIELQSAEVGATVSLAGAELRFAGRLGGDSSELACSAEWPPGETPLTVGGLLAGLGASNPLESAPRLGDAGRQLSATGLGKVTLSLKSLESEERVLSLSGDVDSEVFDPGTRLLLEVRPVDGAGGEREWGLLVALSLRPPDLLKLLPGDLGGRLETLLGDGGDGLRTFAYSTHVHPCPLTTIRKRLSGDGHEGSLPAAEGQAGDGDATLFEVARRHGLDPALFLIHNAARRDLLREGSLSIRLPAPRTVRITAGDTVASILAGLGATLEGVRALRAGIFDAALLEAGGRDGGDGQEIQEIAIVDPEAADGGSTIDRIRISAPVSLSDLLAHHGLGLGNLTFEAFGALRLAPSRLRLAGRRIDVERGWTLATLIDRCASKVPELAGMTPEIAYSAGVILDRLTVRGQAGISLPGVARLTRAQLDDLVREGEIPAWVRDRARAGGDGLFALAGAAAARGINLIHTLPAGALGDWLPRPFRLPADSTLTVAVRIESAEDFEASAKLGTDLELPGTPLTLSEVEVALAPDWVRLGGTAEVEGLPGQRGKADVEGTVRIDAGGDFAVTAALGESDPLSIEAAGVGFSLGDVVLTWSVAAGALRLTAHGQLEIGEDVRLGSSLEIADGGGATHVRLAGELHSERPLEVGELLGHLEARGAAPGDPKALPPELRRSRLTGLTLELDTGAPKVRFEAFGSGKIPLGRETVLVFGSEQAPSERAIGIRIGGDAGAESLPFELAVTGGLGIGGAALEGHLRFTHDRGTTALAFQPTVVRAPALGLTGKGVDQTVDLGDLAAAFTGRAQGSAALHLGFGEVKVEASTEGEVAWRTEANLSVRLSGVPGLIGSLINDHEIPMVLAAGTEGVSIGAGLPESRYGEAATADPLLAVDFPFKDLQGEERALALRLVAARFEIEPGGVSIGGVVAADLEALKKSAPQSLPFEFFTDVMAFSVGVAKGHGEFGLLTSPFAFGPTIENGWLKLTEGLPESFDFGDLDLQLPVLKVGQPPRVGGAAKWDDLKLPLGWLKALLRHSEELSDAAGAIPESLPLEFPDPGGGDELSRLGALVQTVGERAGVETAHLQSIRGKIDELRGWLDKYGLKLPAALGAYLRPPNLKGFEFDVAVRPSAGLGFELKVSADPEGDPIRILFPVGPTTLGGLTLRSLSIGELFGGSIVTVAVDASFDQFDLLSIGVAAARLGGGEDRLENLRTTLTLRELYMWIVLASGVPIPLPLTYDELSCRYHGAFGEELQLGVSFPIPSELSLVGLLGTAAEVVGALQAGQDLQPDAFAGLVPEWRLDAARLRLPDFMGDLELGSVGTADSPVWKIGGGEGLVRILNPVAAAARAVKRQPFGLAGLLVATVPLEQRSGRRQTGLEMACIEMGFDWAVVSGAELGAGAPPKLVDRMRRLPGGGKPAEVLRPVLPFELDGDGSDRPFLTLVGSWETGVADVGVVLGLLPSREQVGVGIRLLAALGDGETVRFDVSGQVAVESGAGGEDRARLTVEGAAKIAADVLPELFAGAGTIELSPDRLTMTGTVHLVLGEVFEIAAGASLTLAPGTELALATTAPARPTRLDLVAATRAALDGAQVVLDDSIVAGFFASVQRDYERRKKELGRLIEWGANLVARKMLEALDDVIDTAASAKALGKLQRAARDLARACRDYRDSRVAWKVTPSKAKELIREMEKAAEDLARTATESNVKKLTQHASKTAQETFRKAERSFNRARELASSLPEVESLSVELRSEEPLKIRLTLEGVDVELRLSTDPKKYKDGVVAAAKELVKVL